jgi:hypothetical protein
MRLDPATVTRLIVRRHREDIEDAVRQMAALDIDELIDLAHEYAALRNRLEGDDLRHVYQVLHDSALNEIDTRIRP